MSKYHKVDMQLVLCCTKDGTTATPKRSLAEGLFEKTNDMQIGVARHSTFAGDIYDYLFGILKGMT